MKSWGGNSLTVQAQKRREKISTLPHPHKPPSKWDSARAATVHSQNHPFHASPSPRMSPKCNLLRSTFCLCRYPKMRFNGFTRSHLGFQGYHSHQEVAQALVRVVVACSEPGCMPGSEHFLSQHCPCKSQPLGRGADPRGQCPSNPRREGLLEALSTAHGE